MHGGIGEFQEIGHCGGKVIFGIVTSPEGRRSYQVTSTFSRPVPASMFAVYALPQGAAVGTIRLGGIGQPWNQPPITGCYPVFIASDTQGNFGCQCPQCRGYWRARGGPSVCPYCGLHAERHDFLSDAQREYVAQYCDLLHQALQDGADGDYTIDMDAVADAAGKDAEKPPFYYAEESQQHQFRCGACGGFNDIIGRFGYCSACGTRNDLAEFTDQIVPRIRTQANGGGPFESCLKEAASAFDSFVAQYVKQLVQHVPMRHGRKARLSKMRFYHLQLAAAEIEAAFDIDLFEGLSKSETGAAKLMFNRRHVYEHNGGEADEKYITESGDTTVRLKQMLRETQSSVHQFTSTLVKMATNLHRGFHDIFPPEQEPIDYFRESQATMNARRQK